MRGEHESNMDEIKELLGSPPHARGTLSGGAIGRYRIGITPACAGNTLRGRLFLL